MVRTIYQTNGDDRNVVVVAGVSLSVALSVVVLVLWFLGRVSDCVCDMPGYWNKPLETYAVHAGRALSMVGYRYASIKDKGDWPSRREYHELSSVKLRRFVVSGLVLPDGRRIERAQVIIKFDGKARPLPETTVERCDPL